MKQSINETYNNIILILFTIKKLIIVFLFTNVNLPENPINIWNRADTAIAPESSLMRTCQSSSCSTALILLMLSIEGHLHWGSFKIANVGTRNEIVPPCTIGNLKNYEMSTKILLLKSMFFKIIWSINN